MNEIFKTERNGTYTFNLIRDLCPTDPLEYIDLFRLYTNHKKYSIGEDFNKHYKFYSVFNVHGKIKEELYKGDYIFPLYKFEHSNILLSIVPFSCKFDSCLFGIVAINRDLVRELYNIKDNRLKLKITIRKKLLESIHIILDEYNKYLNGEVYAIEVINNENPNETIIDYYGGIYMDCMPEEFNISDYIKDYI